MDNKELISKIEEYYRSNIPSSRGKSYFPHVDGVRRYGLILADKYQADKVVVEAAALLHDVGADAGKVHAERSAELADLFLTDLNLDNLLKEKIISAIKNHSMNQAGENFAEEVPLEDQIIRDADGLSFLENSIPAYFEKSLKLGAAKDKAKKETMAKVDGMRKKIATEEGRKLADDLAEKAAKIIDSL